MEAISRAIPVWMPIAGLALTDPRVGGLLRDSMGPGSIILFAIIGVAAIALLLVVFWPKKALPPIDERPAIDASKKESPNWEQPAEEGAKAAELLPPERAKPSEPPPYRCPWCDGFHLTRRGAT